ncbi:MAG: hypothetical protein R2792_06720 [Saprospiraceae bacterium]|jgi:hypothetical protein
MLSHLKKFFALVAFLSCTLQTQAQMERTIYQVFEVDSAQSILLDIAGIYEIHPWAGTNVLAETNIQIWHASPEILEFLIKNGRYDLVAEKLDGSFQIYTKERDRKPLKTREGEVTEIAKAKLFVPDFYTWEKEEDMTVLRRKE